MLPQVHLLRLRHQVHSLAAALATSIRGVTPLIIDRLSNALAQRLLQHNSNEEVSYTSGEAEFYSDADDGGRLELE